MQLTFILGTPMTLLKKSLTTLACAYILTAPFSSFAHSEHKKMSAWSYMAPLTDPTTGIGARPAGSKAEKKAADWLVQQWQKQGYQPKVLPFDYQLKDKKFNSQNIQVDIKGKSDKIIVIGAHYDSTGEDHGSLGATDNASGVAAMLALSAKIRTEELPYTVRFLAFGAEEVGLQGAKAYIAKQLKNREKLVAMVNLDTIIGGDKLYVHSAHTTPYECKGIPNSVYNAETHIRDGLKAISGGLFNDSGHQLHPAYDGYPEGVTGSWSDHSPFACAGIPIAYLEATNFAINGHSGNDGYSQTEKTQLWDCYDSENKTACNREKEKSWGMIWHTQFDRLDTLQPVMQGRLKQQLEINVDVLEKFVLTAKNYL